jgi:hypothetical protein
MTTKQALITLLAFMVTIPCLVYGWAHLMVWMGGMR